MSNLTKETMGGRKNLNIAEDTYDRLRKRGKFGESFDDLLNRLLNELEESEGKEKERKTEKPSKK